MGPGFEVLVWVLATLTTMPQLGVLCIRIALTRPYAEHLFVRRLSD